MSLEEEPSAQERIPVLYRSFGEADTRAVGRLLHLAGDHLWVLTTKDYKYVGKYESLPHSVTTDFTDDAAAENCAGFLNEGLSAMLDSGIRQTLLMASGFERDYQFIKNSLSPFLGSVPGADVYFFITPSVHEIDWENEVEKLEGPMDMYELRSRLFPSESLAYVDIEAVYPLNESLSRKGVMGKSSLGDELGGIELIITLLEKYTQSGKKKKPRMCGIYTTGIKRDKKFYFTDYPPNRRVEEYLDSVESTPKEVKDRRREETIDATLERLGLTPGDYNDLFSETTLVDGRQHMLGSVM